jgi:phenylacetate-CoA ligase
MRRGKEGEMLWQPELEAMPAADRARLQSQRLRDLLERLRHVDSDYWRGKLAGVSDVGGVEDLASLPFTVKAEFRDHYPFGMLAVARGDCVRVHASSGTRGKPTLVAYTAADVDVFAEVNARAIAAAGIRPGDVLHVAYGYGLFTGGLGLHYGGERLGATVVPASGGNTALQLQLLADMGAVGLCATPSFAMLLAERAQAGEPGALRVRYGVLGAEPWSDSFREKLEAAWSGVTGEAFDACDIYGLSEIIGPGVAMECGEGKGGLHVFSDHFLPEIVDPASGEPVAEGAQGELVLTTLTKQALPVLRYRTGDLTRFLPGDCPCGRTFPRIARFTGRVDDMLVIRGVNVFPSEVEAVVLAAEELTGQYALVVDRRETMPSLQVRAEVREPMDDEARSRLAERCAARLLERLRLSVDVHVGEPGSLPRQEVGKARRVFERTGEHDPVGE